MADPREQQATVS